MGKVQILAVLTMDGCLPELYDKAHQDLCLDRCGLDEIREKALYHVTTGLFHFNAARMAERRYKHCYLAEATQTSGLYQRTAYARCGRNHTIHRSFHRGNRTFSKSALLKQHWTLSSLTIPTVYTCAVYVALSISLIKKQDSQNVRQAYISIFRNRINVLITNNLSRR